MQAFQSQRQRLAPSSRASTAVAIFKLLPFKVLQELGVAIATPNVAIAMCGLYRAAHGYIATPLPLKLVRPLG